MSYTNVKFLDECYKIPNDINVFLECDLLAVPFVKKFLDKISDNFNRDLNLNPGDFYKRCVSDIDDYCDIINDGIRYMVEYLIDKGIYDVTEKDFSSHISAFSDLNNLFENIGQKLCREAKKIIEYKNAGMEKAYRYAASGITGSGVRIYTNRLSTLLMSSLIERNTLMSQAKKADAEYEAAVKRLTAQATSTISKMCVTVMVNECYPVLPEIAIKYNKDITAVLVAQMAAHNMFDFSVIEGYNSAKADEMLKNIYVAKNKREFLKQVFLCCPFNLNLYKTCMVFDLLDIETFKTAEYFGLGKDLVSEVTEYCKQNSNEFDKLNNCVKVLAYHENKTEVEIWNWMYLEDIKLIKQKYKFIHSMREKCVLEGWIEHNISKDINTVINMGTEKIFNKIDLYLKNIVPKEKYDKLMSLGLNISELIRIKGSVETDIDKINIEIENILHDKVDGYLKECIQKKKEFDLAYEKYTIEVSDRVKEIELNRKNLNSLGFFEFNEKKRLKDLINSMENSLNEFKRLKEPKFFNRM